MYCLAIDWLTIYGSVGVNVDDGGRLPNVGRWSIDYTSDRVTLYFKHCAKVRRDGFLVGVICHTPTGHIMHPSTISFKVDNALLYTSSWYDDLLDFLIAYNVRFVNVTRCDFALDFDAIGRFEWNGAEMAQRFIDGRLLRYGSRKYKVIGSTSRKVQPDGSVDAVKGGVESITFGTHNSVCQFQLYNKSLELRQHSVGDYCPKQYIREGWKQAGLDTSCDIWRIELRLSGNAKTLVNHLTGEIQPLSLLSLAPDHIVDTIRAVFARWAIIYDASVATASTATHIDRLPRIAILECGSMSIVAVRPERKELPNARYIKGVLTTLRRFSDELNAYLADPCDRYIVGDAERAMHSVYSVALWETRQREAVAVRERNALSLLALLEFKPNLSPYEEHLYSYLKVTHNI